MTVCFTDGASHNNGYSNCRCSWAVYFNENDSRNEAGEIFDSPSNQKAELYAIYKALEKTKNDENVAIVTDSKYSIDCLTKWHKNWEKNNWKTTKKEVVKHSKLIQDCLEITAKKQITWVHINSHKKEPKDKTSNEWFLWKGNNMADKMCTEKIKVFFPFVNLNNVKPNSKDVFVEW